MQLTRENFSLFELFLFHPEAFDRNDLARWFESRSDNGFINKIHYVDWIENVAIIHVWLKDFYKLKNYTIPLKRTHLKELRPLANIYISLYRCCEVLHSFLPNRYPSAMFLWLLLLEERFDRQLKGKTKTQTVNNFKSFNSKLRQYQNPTDEDLTHSYRLFAALVKNAESSGRIDKECLKPVCKAVTEYIKFLKSKDSNFLGVDGKTFYTAFSSGRGRRVIDDKISVDEMHQILDQNKTFF